MIRKMYGNPLDCDAADEKKDWIMIGIKPDHFSSLWSIHGH